MTIAYTKRKALINLQMIYDQTLKKYQHSHKVSTLHDGVCDVYNLIAKYQKWHRHATASILDINLNLRNTHDLQQFNNIIHHRLENDSSPLNKSRYIELCIWGCIIVIIISASFFY